MIQGDEITQGDGTDTPPPQIDPETIEAQIAKMVIEQEYNIGKQNMASRIADLESAIDMLECERTEKNYDWNSDIFWPEFASQMLTQSSLEANQYFQSRDFVEVYIEDGSDQAIKSADANKELINRTLNQRYLHHFHKFMQANVMKNISGEVYLRCGWERMKVIRNISVSSQVEGNTDQFGNPIVDRSIQVPQMQTVTEMQPQEKIIRDRFNYEVLDRRNVCFDDSYVYSMQDKHWITIREEKTLDQLKLDAEAEGYINIDKLSQSSNILETDTSRESYNKVDGLQKTPLKGNYPLDVIHRYGKFWVIVNNRDELGNPTDIQYGINRDGEPSPGAELVETIISIAMPGSRKQLIRFMANSLRDSNGEVYRPIIRGLCYIHPTKDSGLGDGKACRELQIGLNDTLNVSNDRVMLATLPTLKAKKYSSEQNETLYFKPGHTMMVENVDDISEFKIEDNIQGALQQIGMYRQGMSGYTSIFPPALGSTPELASTTATAVAGSEQNKSLRSNYRALTSEHTFLNELYWMITQMTHQFATPDTANKLMGDKMYDFDPSLDYMYKPLSQSIENEYSKANKIRELTQLIGFVAPMSQVNPKAAGLVNFMLSKIFMLYGDEMQSFKDTLLDENAPVNSSQMPANTAMPMQNQSGMPQSGAEQNIRMGASMR